MKKTKLYKAADIFIKIAIIVVSYYIIYRELFYNQNYKAAFIAFDHILTAGNIVLILIPLFLLMVVNWGVEAIKWKILVAKFENISLWDSFKAILAGTTISSVFPNRAGEFIGRVFILKKENIIKGTLVTFIGNISQLIITIIIGLISALAFSWLYIPQFINIGFLLQASVSLIIMIIIHVILYLYFNISVLQKIGGRRFKKRFKKLSYYLEVFGEYDNKELSGFLLLSFLRYLVFSMQFYLCFLLFGIKLSIFDGLLIISSIYLLITAIPTVAMSELGVRGSVSLFVFGLFFNSLGNLKGELEIAIVAASALIWIINLIVPAIIGSGLILKFKLVKK